MKYLIVKDRKSFIRKRLDEETSFSCRGFSVYCRKNRFYLNAMDGFHMEDGSKICRLENRYYVVSSEKTFREYEIYVYKSDEGIDDFAFFTAEDFILSAASDSRIVTHDPYIKTGRLSFKDGRIDTDLDISVNRGSYDGLPLKRGDQIEYLGIRIFFYGDFLYINRFMMDIHLPPHTIRYGRPRYAHHLLKRTVSRKPAAELLVLPEFREYKPLDEAPKTGIVRTILPALVMSLSVAAIPFLGIYENGGRQIKNAGSLIYIVSPLAMLLTGAVLQLLFYIHDRKKEKRKIREHEENYLDYLKGYLNQAEVVIEEYVNLLSKHGFSVDEVQKAPFYLNENDEDFLRITIGKIYEKRSFIYRTGLKKIDLLLRSIEDRLAHIGPVPLFLDLKKERYVTVVSSKKDRQYFFLRFLLEIAFRHGHEDLHIAIYAKDKDSISDFYDLPNLFFGRKRLFVTQERDLQLLEQLVLQKPLILFALAQVPFVYRNPQIRVLYFSNDMNDLLKNSDIVIEYLGNSAFLHAGVKKEFICLREAFDFGRQFRRLGECEEMLSERKKSSFFELFSKFDIQKSYETAHRGLRADFACSEGQLLYFDLHQNRQGPHGLIGGSTGSGKTELIVSLLLSLCIRYSPEYLNIVLIDYKGGGIREALTYEGICLPHIAAAVSNLEENVLERLIIALRNLSLERQRLFQELSKKSGLPIRDLDEYAKADLKSYSLKKIPHLLIVVDEFAELKKNHPELIRELVSISRIGRSLGIHLILSTQKPAGNIDEEIWSNARFKIALKVYEERDSLDLIRSKDAAALKRAGDFLLKVDDRLTFASAIYSGNDVNGNEPYEVCLLKEDLEAADRRRIAIGEQMSEAAFFLRRILQTCRDMNCRTEKLDFLPPAPMERRKLAKGPCIVMGEIDDYLRKYRGLLGYSLKEDLLICSRRPKEAAAVFNVLNENRLRCVFIGSKRRQGKTCADSFLYEEDENIGRIFEMLPAVREKTTLLIEDLNILFAYEEEYRERFLKLLKQKGGGLSIVAICSDPQIGFKVVSAFHNRILIENSDPSAFSCLFPMKIAYKADSYFYKQEVSSFVPVLCEDFTEEKTILLPLLKRYPDRFDFVLQEGKCLLGYDQKSREEVFSKCGMTIASYDDELLEEYCNAYSGIEGMCFAKGDELRKMPDAFLWIGPGVFNQRIFVTGLRQDLKENEGIYFEAGKRRLLRCIRNG